VKKKQAKVAESAGTYTAKPSSAKAAPAQPGIRLASLQEVRKANAKLIQVHRKVLQKLAQ